MDRIRTYYTPMQPSICKKDPSLSYQEIPPDKELQSIIYCFWQLKTAVVLKENFSYRVVSDGCIDIFFSPQNPEENFVMGFCKRYTEFPLGKNFNYIGIRFLPATFPWLFGCNAYSLSNQAQALQNIAPEMATWIAENVRANHSMSEITEKLQDKLLKEAQKRTHTIDLRFLNALIFIFKKKGYLDTENDLQTGLSSRQLLRLFHYYIGTSVKSFSNVVRFQYLLNTNPSKESFRTNKLYLDVGFFDQAHFIKSFKTHYGVTPTQAFL